jgi:hypothetical protein
MWGLLLPITVHGRVSDIWRSYFTQSIMWHVGLTLAMSRPWVIQNRNAHNYLGDFQAEQNLYHQTGALLEYLSLTSTNSSDASSIPGMIESLYINMYEHGVVEIEDIEVVQAWLSDLISVGYTFPQIGGQRQGTLHD